MNPYKGNGKPFVYVYFPQDEKERVLSILEKFVQKNGNVSFWWSEKPLKKPEKVIDAAFSVIAFIKQAQINDKDFQNVIDAAVRCEKKILPIHLEETEYNTPWSRLALGSKQGIIRSAYKDDEQLLEKMTGAETFVDMKVTARQKKNRRSQLLRIIGGLLASALGIVGVLFFTGMIGFDPGDEKRTVQIGDFSISGTQAELDKITTLCIYGDREPTNYLVDKRVDLRGTTDDYSTFYVNPRQITEDNYLIFDNQLIRRGKISDLNWVKYLRNLEVLILDGQCIIDISPVFELKKLKRLDMMCNFVESLDGIEVMENLEYVNFSYNKLTDVSSLFRCPNIHDVCLAFNYDLTDLGCDYAPQVWALDITGTKGEKMPLMGVGRRVWVNCAHTRVTDYSFLRETDIIDLLVTSGNVKSTLLPVLKGKVVHTLVWEYADIESMQEIADSGVIFSGTHALSINRSKINSLEGIENIRGGIRRLNLFENDHLSDLIPIKNLPGLVSLGYDSRLEYGDFNVKEYCSEHNISTFTLDEYEYYDIWTNNYAE